MKTNFIEISEDMASVLVGCLAEREAMIKADANESGILPNSENWDDYFATRELRVRLTKTFNIDSPYE